MRLATRRPSGTDLEEHLVRERAHLEVDATLARTDQLTGLPNRRGIVERLRVLRGVAGSSTEVLRDSDVVGRWGGDERIVVLAGTTAGTGNAGRDRITC